MHQHEKIELRKERDFGEIINVTFQFLRQNLRTLGKGMLFILGPAALLMGLASAGSLTQWNDLMLSPDDLTGFDPAGIMLFVMVFVVMAMFTSVLAILVVCGYIVLYQDRGRNAIEIGDIWRLVLHEFPGVMGLVLLVGVVFFVIYMGIVVPIGIFIGIGSPVAAALVGILAFFGGMAAMVYFMVTYSLAFPIRIRESTGLIEALRRSHYLIKRNWWSTFLVVFISYFLMMILGLLFNLPRYALSFMDTYFSLSGEAQPWYWWPTVIASIVGTLGSALLYAIPLTAIMVQYYSLVEKKENKGLLDRIEGLSTEESGASPDHDQSNT